MCTVLKRKRRPSLSSSNRIPTDATCLSRVDTALPLILHILVLHIPAFPSLVPLDDVPSTTAQSQMIRGDEVLALRRRPLARLPWLDFEQEHGVDLLKRSTCCLGQEEENDEHGDEVKASEEVAVREADVAHDEGRGEADEEVEGL